MPEIGGLVESLNERASRVRSSRVRMLCKDGSWKSLQLRGRPALDATGAVVGHVITMQDTTERDNALRALSVLSEGNRVLARVDDEEDLLQQMCGAVVATGGYPLAWYGLGWTTRLGPWAPRQRRAEPRLRRAHRDPWATGHWARVQPVPPSARARRRCATALPTARSSRHGARPPRPRPRSGSISLPIRSQGEIDGALMVYAAEPHAFDQQAQSCWRRWRPTWASGWTDSAACAPWSRRPSKWRCRTPGSGRLRQPVRPVRTAARLCGSRADRQSTCATRR